MARRHEGGIPRDRTDASRDRKGDAGSQQASRSRVYDEPPLEPSEPDRGGSRHTLHDDDVPEVRFGGNIGRKIGDTGGHGSEANLRDLTDGTSAGHHAGYGDYGQQDYGPHGGSAQELPRRRGGDSRRGSFRGRGPKGYTRSDERLREVVCEMLTDDPDVDASDITVTVSSAVVTLDGSVADHESGRRVEEMIGRVAGAREVRNQLRASGSAASEAQAPAASQQESKPSPTATQGGVGRETPKTG